MTTANSAVKAAMTAEDKKMLERIYWRSFFQMAGRVGGQVRMHAVGIIFTLAPALERYCKTPEKHREALMRHSTFFNITQTVSTFCRSSAVPPGASKRLRPASRAMKESAKYHISRYPARSLPAR